MSNEECTSIPGFVDLQVNGYRGTSFSSPELTKESFAAACRAVLDEGTAAFLATVVTAPIEAFRRNLPLIAEVVRSDEFRGRILGIHLEGPFISEQAGFVGSHDLRYVHRADTSLLRQMLEWAEGTVCLLTLAAELPGAEELACCARERGATVSVGHSACTEADLERLVRAGATSLTHLGNALPNLLPRHENPIWAGLDNDDLTAMIIADGFHLPSSVIKTVLRTKGVEKTVVVSDVSSLAGLPPGEFDYSGSRIAVENSGRVYNLDRDCLAGAGVTMLSDMNHLASLRLLSLSDLLAVGFHNPLHLIGIDPKDLRAESRLVYESETAQFSVYV